MVSIYSIVTMGNNNSINHTCDNQSQTIYKPTHYKPAHTYVPTYEVKPAHTYVPAYEVKPAHTYVPKYVVKN
jgi:hypothetical protein